MRLRPYKPCDGERILSWIHDEQTFRKWSTNHFPCYPITAEDMNHKYFVCNGNCPEPDNFYPMTAVLDGQPVGHLTMRYTDEARQVLRFGFIIVDDSKRGAGYGKAMLRLALKYAFELLGAQKITIGVLENNPGAYHCYQSVGFQCVPTAVPTCYNILGEDVKCLELELKRE